MTTTTSFQYSHTIGFYSNRDKGFQHPVDVALDSLGVLYVLSRAGPEVSVRIPYKRITICTAEEEYLGEFGTGGMGDGDLWWPSCLAFDSDETLYVADEALNRISVFAKDGRYLGQWGSEGAGDGQINRPSAMVFDREDNLYLTDSVNHRVQKFSREGRYLGKWGGPGTGPAQFNFPWGIALDGAGNVYVADWRNDRVQKFDPSGEFMDQLGASGDGDGQFYRPAGLSVDGEGNIYVADWGNERVQVMTQRGDVLASFRGDSVDSTWSKDYFLTNPDEAAARRQADLEPEVDPLAERHREQSANVEKLLWGPTAVKVDGQGRIFIVDSCRHRLQVYQKN